MSSAINNGHDEAVTTQIFNLKFLLQSKHVSFSHFPVSSPVFSACHLLRGEGLMQGEEVRKRMKDVRTDN